ncbi:FAD/NAD(P)-binding protein [Pseudoclavibacter soli]|uniref:FAD/NAD(P)-binding protein n=1 Tax=Pseudoclavibacter soli TaxID=452623 RepID=UPI00041B389A|nr:FAD/NAD(P)-binding protein [Pseudoclavibacter soli]
MSNTARVVIIGGGPRGIGVLERLIENARRDAPDTALEVRLIDPYPVGPGRVWRRDQSGELRLNSLAGEVSLFTDVTSTIDGPVAPGPSVAEWAEQVRTGVIKVPIDDAGVIAEIEALTPRSFPTRRLHSHYLDWFTQRAIARAPEHWHIVTQTGTVTAVRDAANGAEHPLEVDVHESASEAATLGADAVIYAVGHVDAQIAPRHRAIAEQASALGLRYLPPAYASDLDLSNIDEHDTVLLRGSGLSFVDLVVRLTVDRGGRYTFDPEAPLGHRVTYAATGREPRILTGSRRGVPYHAKTTSHLQGENHGFATEFFTADWLREYLDTHEQVDFVTEVWPEIQHELAHAYYRELFSGHPDRVTGTWAELQQLFAEGERFDGPVIAGWLADHVADADRIDFERLQRPLTGIHETDTDHLQQRLREYLLDDLLRHESDEYSEQTALVQAIIGATFVLGEQVAHPAWSDATRVEQLTGFWHNLFSFIASGPPGERLELLIALVDAGVLEFLGVLGEVELTDSGYVVHSETLGDTRTASVLVEAYQPQCSVSASANPALTDLHLSGQGHERAFGEPDRLRTNGKLVVQPGTLHVVAVDGTVLPRRWASGEFTDGGRSAAFARPGTNALTFRLNDRLAREVLTTVGLLEGTVDAEGGRAADLPLVDIGPAAIDAVAAREALAATAAHDGHQAREKESIRS